MPSHAYAKLKTICWRFLPFCSYLVIHKINQGTKLLDNAMPMFLEYLDWVTEWLIEQSKKTGLDRSYTFINCPFNVGNIRNLIPCCVKLGVPCFEICFASHTFNYHWTNCWSYLSIFLNFIEFLQKTSNVSCRFC